MIYVTGDTHGDAKRFHHRMIKKLRKGDSLIVCGDFGFLWDGSKREKKLLKWIGKRRYNVLFVDGCHENYSLLETFETAEWNGGMTRVISGKLRQLLRGEVYTIDGKTVFAFGGGQSDDNELRKSGKTWWEQEAPTEAETSRGLRNLAAHGCKVDYIVTHEPPAIVKEFLDMNTLERSHVNTFLNEVKEKCTFQRWFFGKCHINKIIPPQYYALFDNVVKADKE